MKPNHNSLSPQTSIVLPFDVLGIIFEYYVETESLFYPLEILLLVCRLWNLAALGHKSLWGNLHIHLGHIPTHNAWKTILPRRVERAGSAPLSIEIRYALEGFNHPYYKHTERCNWGGEDYYGLDICSCTAYVGECVDDLLEILAGPGGEYCKRWTKLHMTLGGRYRPRDGSKSEDFRPSILCDPLSHPMPILESIHLNDIAIAQDNSQIPFPSTPSVRSVYFEHCEFDSLDGANFSSAESITFRVLSIEGGSSNILKFDPTTAIKVINIDGIYSSLPRISGSLPNLHTLRLGTNLFHGRIAPDFQFPSLKTLTISVTSVSSGNDFSFIEKFISSTSRPLSSVEVLTLQLPSSPSRRITSRFKSFVDELESIQFITAPWQLLGLTLKYILEANLQREGSRIWSNLSGRTLELVDRGTGSMAHLAFVDTMRGVDIFKASRKLDIPDPRVPWEQYIEDLQLKS